MVDRLVKSMKLLIAVGSFATSSNPLGAAKSGLSIYEAVRKLSQREPPGLSDLADQLAGDARVVMRGFAADLTGASLRPRLRRVLRCGSG